VAHPCAPDDVELAHRLAAAAAAAVRPHFRQPLPVDAKADLSPVTAADREAELAMRAILEAERPAHGVQGEEFGVSNPHAEWRWILDPIDGTKSFISGSPLFGTLIGLVRGRDASLGLLDQPILGERWLAHGEAPTTLNGRPVRARPCAGLNQATVYTSGLEYWRNVGRDAFERLYGACRLMRFSADCYAAGLLACGFVDLLVEPDMHPHDYAALVPIVENAGGIATDFAGRPLDFTSRTGVLCAGDRRAHAEAVRLLGSARATAG
jgi:inositol-phosphate phosphatase / L-galactose 1-phosphate phosphatase / histidinol-phosphatase